MCSLGIEPTTFALLTQSSNHWATGTLFTISRSRISRFFVMLVLLFCKLSEQYSQTKFPINKALPNKGNKKRGKKEWQIFIIIIICYIYIELFWVLKALYIEGGDLLIHHQCAASTWWCDGSHIAPEHPPHTSYRWRGDRVMKPISVRGWLGGRDGQRPI